MDPVSQAVVGAAASQLGSNKARLAQAAVIGGLAAMTPDLDVVIRSADDPLLALEFHRHFSHSLALIPIIALICAVVSYFIFATRWQLSFKTIFLWSFLGVATHGLLDACTTYGTHLVWPFSNARVAWNTISVVDPLFTLPLTILVIGAAVFKSRTPLFLGVTWAVLYLIFGMIQNQRADDFAKAFIAERGHSASLVSVKPSFANLMIWKLVYEHDGYFYVDAIRAGFSEYKVWEGDRIEKLNVERHFPWLDASSQQAKDIERFMHFSSGYIAMDTSVENRIIDIRYSLLPQDIDALWGIDLDPDVSATEHVEYFTNRGDAMAAIRKLYQMIVNPAASESFARAE